MILKKRKKAMLFSFDAMIALVIIMIALFVIYPNLNTTLKEEFIKEDVIVVLSTLKIGVTNNLFVQNLIKEGIIRDLDKTILEQIGEFFVYNKTLAKELANEFLKDIKTNDNIGIWINQELITSINQSDFENAKFVDIEKQFISGISNNTLNSTTLSSARIQLTSFNKEYYSFGGYVGEGNISLLINNKGNLTDVKIEMAINKDFNLYINNKFCKSYKKSQNNLIPANYEIYKDCPLHFIQGINKIEVVS